VTPARQEEQVEVEVEEDVEEEEEGEMSASTVLEERGGGGEAVVELLLDAEYLFMFTTHSEQTLFLHYHSTNQRLSFTKCQSQML